MKRYQPAEGSQERSRGSRSAGITVPVERHSVIDCSRDLIDPGAPAARDHVSFAEEHVAVLPQAHLRRLDPILGSAAPSKTPTASSAARHAPKN